MSFTPRTSHEKLLQARKAENIRHPDRPDFLFAGEIAYRQDGERSRLRCLPVRFDGRELHGLCFIHVLAVGMSAEEDQHTGDQTDQRCHLKGAFEYFHVLFTGQMVGAHAQDQETGGGKTSGNSMPEE